MPCPEDGFEGTPVRQVFPPWWRRKPLVVYARQRIKGRPAGLGVAVGCEYMWGGTALIYSHMAGFAHEQVFHKVAGSHRTSEAEGGALEWGRDDKRSRNFHLLGWRERYIQPVEAACPAAYHVRAAAKKECLVEKVDVHRYSRLTFRVDQSR